MVIIFSTKETAIERQIADILISCGAEYISDTLVHSGNSFSAAVVRKGCNIDVSDCVALLLDCSGFKGQSLLGVSAAVCEDENALALKLLSKSSLPVISCGMNSRNTVTLSSISGSVMASVQRSFFDLLNSSIMPGEYRIRLKKDYSHFAVMAAFSVLLLHGIIPTEF